MSFPDLNLFWHLCHIFFALYSMYKVMSLLLFAVLKRLLSGETCVSKCRRVTVYEPKRTS